MAFRVELFQKSKTLISDRLELKQMIIKVSKRRNKLSGKKRKDIGEFLLEYSLLFLCVICTTSVWTRYGFLFSHIQYLKALIPVVCILIIGKLIFLDRKVMLPIECLYYIIFFALCIFSSLFSEYPDFITAVFLFAVIICFMLVAYLSSPVEMEVLWMRFVNIICIISLISLFFYSFSSILNVISPTGTVTYTWDWERKALSYFDVYYAPTSQKSDTMFNGIQRNCGIFTEGTMFAFYLIIAYMVETCYSMDRRYMKIILFVTLLTTFSTTGIFAIFIFEGIRLIGSNPQKRFLKICKILFVPVIVLSSLVALIQLAVTKMVTGSYGVRYDHIVTCFQVFWDTFPIGLGYNGSDALKSSYYYSQGTSVGIPMLLAYGGLGGGLLLVVPIFLYFYYSLKTKNLENLAFGITFIWTFFFTNVVFNSVLPWMVVAIIFLKGSYEMRNTLAYKRGGYCHEIISSILDNLRTKVLRPDIGMAM